MKLKILKFIIVAVAFYIGLNVAVHFRWEYRSRKIKRELIAKYDSNQDGVFSLEESHPELTEGLLKLGSDTARGISPLTLIPVSLLLAILTTYIYNTRRKNY
ncbi:hypothetical protein D1013_18930 [Euzebyella marina]|uniref:EF-hand domain-containing protein n=1 Tax=Euzebyella marina TaxID=1761453 RepID=A0A3G2LAL7_9FLAO|nr:hypothetical protein [Euzebyella marina]AYN69312.1 hypothetical protein D1013_18930 [Euzebyella marina]